MNAQTEHAIRHWPHVAPLLQVSRSKAAYRRLADALGAVLDAGGADESHPLASLADYLGERVAQYEAEHMPMREIAAPDFPRELMKQHALTQKKTYRKSAHSRLSAKSCAASAGLT